MGKPVKVRDDGAARRAEKDRPSEAELLDLEAQYCSLRTGA